MENEFKIVCPFCNAAYTADMSEELSSISAGCDTCGYGAEASITIEVKCTNCGRVVYRKETEVS